MMTNNKMNYFQLLDIREQYDIDQAELKRQYFLMLARYHPDKLAAGTSEGEALALSANINQAYKILQDDYLRAEYLLNLQGYSLDDDTLRNTLSQEELENIWSDFETLEEENDPQKLSEFERQKLEEKSKLISQITLKFSLQNFEEALDLALRLKYLTNLLGNIKLKIRNANNNPD